MKTTAHNSNTFLARYNKIDEVFANTIWTQKYISYSEKVSMIANWTYSSSGFVRQYAEKFRYYGDLRNQIVHWFSLEHLHYVHLSAHAVEDISSIYTQLITPKTIGETFRSDVYTCSLQDSLQEVIVWMRNDLNTHVPVYNQQWTFVEMLSESTIAYRVADQLANDDDNSIHLDDVKVWDVPLENTNDVFLFMSASTSVYEVEQLFEQSFANKKRLWAIFITTNWAPIEPITWIITAMDLPKVASSRIL